jgi:aldehyde:ferredoxin oxidoreductase
MIGPGGELELSGAGISNLDMDRTPTRIAARGGGGAVMGAKRLKAIVIDGEGSAAPPIRDEELFKSARRRFIQALLDHPQTKTYAEFGTAAIMEMVNACGALPTHGFSEGRFEDAELIGGDQLHDTILERGGEGKTTLACMPGCAIRSSNVYADVNGESIVSTLQYETIAMCGSNLGISDLDTIARINYVLNDLGMDSIEMGAALGVAAQAGLLDFGDGKRVMELLAEVRQGTHLGRIIGHGAATVGKVFGVRRVPVVKGQAMPGYDPRAVKGTGITYATSPQGADHTCGLTIRANVDHLSPKGQAELSLNAQISMAGYDTLGACIFTGFGFASSPSTIRDLVKARYGWDLGDEVLQELGKETLLLERAFNRAAGFTSANDRLPGWMTEEPLPPHDTVFDVAEDDLDRLFESLGELPYR